MIDILADFRSYSVLWGRVPACPATAPRRPPPPPKRAEERPAPPVSVCAAAALPQIRPERRKMLLQSLSEAAATAPGWSDARPSFYPEFIDKEAA